MADEANSRLEAPAGSFFLKEGSKLNGDKSTTFTRENAAAVPTVTVTNGDKALTHWLKDADKTPKTDPTLASETVTAPVTYTAYLSDKIVEKKPGDPVADGYVRVDFKAGDGSFGDNAAKATAYGVLKGTTWGEFKSKVPSKVNPPADMSFIGWKPTLPHNDATRSTATLNTVAQKSVILVTPGTNPDKPAGYVTMEFQAGPHTSIDVSKETVKYYVDPDAKVKLGSLRRPAVTYEDGYKASDPAWKVGSEALKDDVTTVAQATGTDAKKYTPIPQDVTVDKDATVTPDSIITN